MKQRGIDKTREGTGRGPVGGHFEVVGAPAPFRDGEIRSRPTCGVQRLGGWTDSSRFGAGFTS